MPDLLPAFLTFAQREAIVHTGGPLLLVAGPGAGKTDVMVRRTEHFISSVISTFSLLTEERADPVGFADTVRSRGAELFAPKEPKSQAVEEYEAVAEAYGRYVELLRNERVMDFATFQRVTYQLLEGLKILAALRDRYRHLLAEEYQDTNRLQMLILRRVVEPGNELGISSTPPGLFRSSLEDQPNRTEVQSRLSQISPYLVNWCADILQTACEGNRSVTSGRGSGHLSLCELVRTPA